MARSSMRAYIQKNVTISFRPTSFNVSHRELKTSAADSPTAVYLLRICMIMMAVIIMATM